jgi:glycerol uptake facilitator-like aquaporin
MNDRKDQRVPWQPIVAEFVGTALLVLVGLSVVILIGRGGETNA